MNQPTLCPAPSGLPRFDFKAQPEDFIVEELALYEPSGSGTHTYFWIEKRQLNTHDAARRLASLLGKRAPDAGIAGLKDAQAVTRQWISFEHVPAEALAKATSLQDKQLSVLKTMQHGNKLKMGHLRGNRFIVRLRVADEAAAQALAARAREVLATLQRLGLPNYYGEQRFGRSGDNAALGKLLVQGDRAAFEELYARVCGGQRPADRKLRNLLVNAFQAELFNQVLARRMPELGRLQPGDLASLHRNGAVFRVASAEDAAREQPRADAFEISPSGPLFGPKTLLAEGEPGRHEAEVLSASGVSLEDFGRREAEAQPGARRPLRVPLLEAPAVECEPAAATLRFALPSGAYASVLINEIAGGVE